MVRATNIDATAVNTIRWLSTTDATIVVPVYQRQYRWDIGGCEQLLADIRSAADAEHRHTHFIGSILSSANSDQASGGMRELVLIDGQQRITTLMLLIAALHHTVRDTDPQLAAQLRQVLVTGDAGDERTKLRPHRAWASVFEAVVLGTQHADGPRDSRFDDNYAFFRSQIPPEDVAQVWAGLQRLEHVSITLGGDANAQQIFESLNSTGEPLRDHELIHNYVLMGLTREQQGEIEDTFWVPIERNTGESIAAFWRHYLVLTTGREVDGAGPRAVYDTFRARFPRLQWETLRGHAAEWAEYSDVFRTLQEPALEADDQIAAQLAQLNTFGQLMYPLIMRAYRDYRRGELPKDALMLTLERIQSLLMRRALVGVGNENLVARMCRAREQGPDALLAAIARVTPSDERARVALKYGELPHAEYVLRRLAGLSPAGAADGGDEFELDPIMPTEPGDNWSADGVREWAELSEDEQNSHRALAGTIGNLTLLEQPLAERGFGIPFPQKAGTAYARSVLALNAELAEAPAWGTSAIAERTARLTDEFLRVWQRPATVGIDDDGLTPILDAIRRRGWPRGWQREFEYVEYRGEHWEVYDVASLFNRIFKRLWADEREHVVAFSSRRGGPIFQAQAWNGQWDQLDENNFLYMGWDSRYMLTALQGVLDEAGLSSEVFVKYSYIGQAM